jgi:colanic acid biosynthesis glycosyl transferase WcaI
LRATFRLRAPDAQKVQVQVGADQTHYDLVKGPDGVWTGTTPPLVPGFHYYYFFVDGVQVNDPASHAFYGVSKDSSGIEVPEKGVDYYEPQQVPHYPTGIVGEPFRGRLIQREDRSGVDVTRVWVPSVDRSRLAARMLAFAAYQVLAAAVGLRRHYDALIISNPVLEAFLPFLVLGVCRRKPIVYSVHEIYPDIGVKLGIFRHRTVIRTLEMMEAFCYQRARRVRVLSDGYARALQAKGVPAEKLSVIYDWLDTAFLQPRPRSNAFSRRWGLENEFVVMYAGNLGHTQGLEQVLNAARLLAGESSLRFVFVGEGAAKAELERAATAGGLTNVRFIPMQPREMLPDVLASGDVSLVTLKKGFASDSVPSELYSILASGRPLIAVVDDSSDTATLARLSGGGLQVPPEDPERLANAVLRLRADEAERRRMGERGRAFVVERHSRQAAARAFDGLLREPVRLLDNNQEAAACE